MNMLHATVSIRYAVWETTRINVVRDNVKVRTQYVSDKRPLCFERMFMNYYSTLYRYRTDHPPP